MSDAQKDLAWYGKYRDQDGTYWDWVCERTNDRKSQTKQDEMTATYPEAANLFMLITYQSAWFSILGLPLYLMMAFFSQIWWGFELVVVVFAGGSFGEIIKLIMINIIAFWSYFVLTFFTIVPGVNLIVPILGFAVYLYVAFQYQNE